MQQEAVFIDVDVESDEEFVFNGRKYKAEYQRYFGWMILDDTGNGVCNDDPAFVHFLEVVLQEKISIHEAELGITNGAYCD